MMSCSWGAGEPRLICSTLYVDLQAEVLNYLWMVGSQKLAYLGRSPQVGQRSPICPHKNLNCC
jgi:hypothetical protein